MLTKQLAAEACAMARLLWCAFDFRAGRCPADSADTDTDSATSIFDLRCLTERSCITVGVALADGAIPDGSPMGRVVFFCAVATLLVHAAQAQTPPPPQSDNPRYSDWVEAEMALAESIWGNEEEFVTHTRGRVPPYSLGSDGKSGPVRVDVGVMIEKVRIDTVQQVATIKWWLRQSWKVRTDIAEGEI